MEAERPLARGTAHPLWPLFVLALGAGVLALVLAHPAVDESWENHPAHFWLVLTAAAINVALGYVVGVEARLRRDGNDQRQLTHPVLRPPAGAHGDAPAAWSPDGSRILYSSEVRGDRELFVMNADGSGKRRVTHWRGGDSPNAWLADGRIVFAHFRGAEPLPHWYLIRPDGSGLRSLPHLYGAGDPLDWLLPS